MRIRLSTTLRWPIERQIPGSWREQGIEIFINQPVADCDAWVVYQGLHRPEETNVPPEHLFFFCYEPPGLHDYQPQFLEQFARVVTSQRAIRHPGVMFRHQAQPWLAGIERHAIENVHVGYGVKLRYEDFARPLQSRKSRRLSVICSRKVMIPGHQARLDFVESLRGDLKEELEVFGYGFQPITDKWEALAPFTYHLVLENSCVPDYWTEKVADAFLAECVPLVWGCPNLSDYFPEGSFVALDPNDVAGSRKMVQQIISSPPDKKRLGAVAEAKRLVMEEYNLFSEIRRMVQNTPASTARNIRIKDERLFMPGSSWRPLARALTDRWRLKK